MLKLEVYLDPYNQPKNQESRKIIVNARNIAIILDDITHYYTDETKEEKTIVYSTIYVGNQQFYITRKIADSVIKHIEATEDDDYNRDVLENIQLLLERIDSKSKSVQNVEMSSNIDISVRALESVDKMLDVLKNKNFNIGNQI